MKLSPRHDQVTRAAIDIQSAVCDAAEKHALTYAELVGILARHVVALPAGPRAVSNLQHGAAETRAGEDQCRFAQA